MKVCTELGPTEVSGLPVAAARFFAAIARNPCLIEAECTNAPSALSQRIFRPPRQRQDADGAAGVGDLTLSGRQKHGELRLLESEVTPPHG